VCSSASVRAPVLLRFGEIVAIVLVHTKEVGTIADGNGKRCLVAMRSRLIPSRGLRPGHATVWPGHQRLTD
jgi:hypothetical protein